MSGSPRGEARAVARHDETEPEGGREVLARDDVAQGPRGSNLSPAQQHRVRETRRNLFDVVGDHNHGRRARLARVGAQELGWEEAEP